MVLVGVAFFSCGGVSIGHFLPRRQARVAHLVAAVGARADLAPSTRQSTSRGRYDCHSWTP